jgi:hypothetical protein
MPGQRLNYAQEIGPARAHNIVRTKYQETCTMDHGTGCWLFNGSTNNDGYGQVSYFTFARYFSHTNGLQGILEEELGLTSYGPRRADSLLDTSNVLPCSPRS